eukprot:CAMPEP_0181525298 /NCGR_PEP_ID=MMETSP1110-20121109/68895_1 /TAXON_ID=174948 /ORGANISM="Symbiodinium sp., Strain CCMP421" /LENGTH=75 /DNA_ID=CAMNT_0023656097 /DNA_START=444 /DNA_END=671 /DNA_ORIENTATION=+
MTSTLGTTVAPPKNRTEHHEASGGEQHAIAERRLTPELAKRYPREQDPSMKKGSATPAGSGTSRSNPNALDRRIS